MTRVVVRRWQAWAPDTGDDALQSESAWRDWAKAPRGLGHEGRPDVPFLPASMRRRATRLTRVMTSSTANTASAFCRAERPKRTRNDLSSPKRSIASARD